MTDLSAQPCCDLHFFKTKRETSTAEPLKHRLSMVDIFVRNVLKSDHIVLDQGFDNSGKQVWGSTHGAFVFKKKV